MRRRHRSGPLGNVLTQDPGKDLFAYLFLLIMVFSFMLLMSFEQQEAGAGTQAGPVEKKSSVKGPKIVSRDQVGRLVKEGDTLLLRFGTRVYDPSLDFDRLKKEDRIVTVADKAGSSRDFLYIEKEGRTGISLYDYLETFQSFSERGVTIAFAREVK